MSASRPNPTLPDPILKILGWLLWLVTIVLGLVEIYFFRQVVLEIYMRFSMATAPADLLGYVVVFLGALVWLAYVIVSMEHLWKTSGRAISWSLFSWAIAIELLILILYFVV